MKKVSLLLILFLALTSLVFASSSQKYKDCFRDCSTIKSKGISTCISENIKPLSSCIKETVNDEKECKDKCYKK
jgi:hypothetical protein